ncbi:MAG: hypothetical protein ACYDH5_00530 [Acidimicrobiales bacterium]
MEPTAERFRALARSSPWRWRTLRFTVSWQGYPSVPATTTVRAWLARPDALRVEGLDGTLLVAERPAEARYDDPMFQSYQWVAMLDPVELADGADPRSGPGRAVQPPVLFDELVEVDHGGRPAWEARGRPSATYWPRCSCCPLLPSPESDALDSPGMPPGFVFGEAHRVHLDLQTGVCVASEELGGWGHQVRIEVVDEAMPGSLFKRPSRFNGRRRSPRR